jgi:hypothetical protein
MGRIYRIYPAQAKLRPVPRLDKLRTGKLVAALDSPNGWQRDTVQRLLVDAPEIRVRYQLALSLGEWNDPRAGQALGHLALKDGEIPAMQTAIMSSAEQHLQELVAHIRSGTRGSF